MTLTPFHTPAQYDAAREGAGGAYLSLQSAMEIDDDVALACHEDRVLRLHADAIGLQTSRILSQLQETMNQRRALLACRRLSGGSMLEAAQRAAEDPR